MKVLKPMNWKTRVCYGMYNYYNNCFNDGSLQYDKLKPDEKELYHICCVVLNKRGIANEK